MAKRENFWTDKNVKVITTMWNKGKTAADIAEALGGITRNAVIGKANRLELKKRPSPIKKSTKTVSKPKKQVKVKKIEMKDVKKFIAAEKNKFSILDIKENMCRWPIGDPKEEGFHFCGKYAVEDCSYCEKHATEAYQVPVARK